MKFPRHPRMEILVVAVVIVVMVSAFLVPMSQDFKPYGNFSTSYEMPNTMASLGPRATSVNPLLSYQTEPAPMGIADYGVGYNGAPYNYTSPSFLGVINITSLTTYNSTAQVLGNMTFQLNLNFVFVSNRVQYDYWVQDVAFLNTSNNQISFLNNVWNLSDPRAAMYNSSVLGNGTVTKSGATSFYYDIAGNSARGNNITLKYPTTVYLKMTATRSLLDLPEVVFSYDDGYGWIVYDNVIFQFASGTTSAPSFSVNGYLYNPFGTYYDSELIMGGPGNSSETVDLNSSVLLMLQYYNGHNYQSIQNAYNFGSDTAEKIYNVNARGVYNNTDGQLYVEALNGTGTLGLVYYSSELATLNITTTIDQGWISLNGTNVTQFSNGEADVTLFPGTYFVILYDSATGTSFDVGNVTLKAGKEYSITSNLYRVKFSESGLQSGVTWYLNITGMKPHLISRSSFTFYLPNGSYNYSVYTNNTNFYEMNGSGTFVVNGTVLNVSITFAPVLYSIHFQENGLPAGYMWSVTMNGYGSLNSTNDSIVFSVTNGTYDYVIPRVANYTSTFSTGSVSVDGNSIFRNVSFLILDGFLIGKISPEGASILVNGSTYNATNGEYNISLPPGYYSVEITAAGYLPYLTKVTISSMNTTHIQVDSLTRKANYSLEIVLVVVLLLALVVALSVSRKKRKG